MPLFDNTFIIEEKPKPPSFHPWQNRIKDKYSHLLKRIHNSIYNAVVRLPKAKEDEHEEVPIDRRKITVIGNRVTKEFIYCANLVKGLHKYRSKYFDAPIIRGVTSVDWPDEWNKLKIQFGTEAFHIRSQVAVLINGEFFGDDEDLKELINKKYFYHLTPDYPKESVQNFVQFVKGSGRPCAYLHIAIEDKHVGTLIFMLYADIVPRTCENFLRLCCETKGGYSGTPIHRIVKDSWVQCGGFGLKSVDLTCENFIVPHDRRGVLCMANADRDVDCSTQFFILLQPQPWMAYKYVAFGQLIDGANVLKTIEEVPAWYESPTKDIIIHHAGLLNLEYQEHVVNASAREYLLSHIDDLTEIGRIFIEMLMERVFLEIEFRMLQRLTKQPDEGDEGEPVSTTALLAAAIANMKRYEAERQAEALRKEEMGSVAADENNDFDVEMYEDEEYSMKSLPRPPSTIPPPPEKKYYIPLTDVLYPGEKDSAYDLKKLLRGDYSLESDLKEAAREQREFNLPGHKIINVPLEPPDSDIELDSNDDEEIKRYIRENVDQVSFAGDMVMRIAKPNDVNLKRPRMSRFTRVSKLEFQTKFDSEDLAKADDFMRSGTHLVYDDDHKTRHSAFAPLVDRSNKRRALPTLKNFNPAISLHHSLLRYSKADEHLLKAVDSRDKFSRHLQNMETLTLQYGKKLGRRISTDYATAVDQVERLHKATIRTLEYAKTRPSMSVAQYKDRNRKLQFR